MKHEITKLSILLSAAIGLYMQMAYGQCVSPPSGLIGWWPGNGNANDASGNGLNGVLMNGTSFASGEVGQAFNFNAANSNYVQVATANSLNPLQGQNWTVEGWIFLATNSSDSFSICHKGDSTGTTDPYDVGQQGFWDFYVSGMHLVWTAGHTGYSAQSANSIGQIIPNQWFQVAVVVTNFGAPNAGFAFYINGTNAGTVVVYEDTVASMTTTEPLRIGCDKHYYPVSGLFDFFQGQIDELAIYNRDLSSSEIAAIYNAGSAGKCGSQTVNIALYPGLQINGIVGQTYGIQSNTNLSAINGWSGVTNLQLTVPTQIWYDSQPDSLSSKFFRVLPGPIPIP